MFFSNKQFHEYMNGPVIGGRTRAVYKRLFFDTSFAGIEVESLTLKEASIILRAVKKRLADRDLTTNSIGLGKWLRPWAVVPALRSFRPPAGDFGIGVEVEMGFRNMQAVRDVAHHIKDWKHIALDREGGEYPLEVTFPPVLYSKIGKKTQVMRYLSYLNTVSHTVINHGTVSSVGTHINVSIGDVADLGPYWERMATINTTVSRYLSEEQQVKYFGRRPYGTLFNRGTHIEFKLFNSQLDPKRLQQYIDIAVSLAKLLVSTTPLAISNVVAALEEGYNKSVRANVSTPAPSLALAA